MPVVRSRRWGGLGSSSGARGCGSVWWARALFTGPVVRPRRWGGFGRPGPGVWLGLAALSVVRWSGGVADVFGRAWVVRCPGVWLGLVGPGVVHWGGGVANAFRRVSAARASGDVARPASAYSVSASP
ncbi:hypothetical protein GCM10012286_15090 [Streptomyces lasiicapitis]|uniref:Uncharacterized protein n=1 Tax=Streptomyces lasiicapitis TaxID=1923961 RepID=A0ABQ2LNR2_9ACTN|nr:hypothetical protein GCM10012286_15090 [Streptomyces lasiicapitis]